MASEYRITLENWLKTLEVKSDSVLDIGATDGLTSKRAKIETPLYHTLDIEGKPDIKLDLQVRTESNTPPDLGMNYKTIFCLEVFEYIYDPFTAMFNIYSWLAEDGVAYITFPFLYPQHEPVKEDMLRYTDEWIKKMAKGVGFTEIQLIPREMSFELASRYNSFLSYGRYHASKNKQHNIMGWIAKLTK